MMRDQFNELERARSAFWSLDPGTDRETWVKTGMAAKAAGRENMAEILQGPTALAIGFDDPIAPVKAFTEHLRARRLNKIGRAHV